MHRTKRSTLIRAGLVGCALIALLVLSWLSPSMPAPSLAAGFTPSPEQPTPPPRPTTPPEEKEKEKPQPCPPSAIRGTVTDLCYGEPARGVQVSINGAVVTTDSFGTYSITGLPPGEYHVTVLVDPAWQPSSETVYLGCDQVAIVDLTFNSCLPPPAPTPTEVVPLIPVTGAAPDEQLPAGLVAIAGLALVLLGIGLWTGSRRTTR
ncbi:MAG: hypothetical protein DDG58_01470 [Ardenticatenia bacterium]|nr:MAG: hypothetical protein DDG58_01470 [Ardenticatenia bacterium]